MKIYNEISEYNRSDVALSLALGTFDGFHIAHRQVIKNMQDFAQKHGLETAVFAFSNIPRNSSDKPSKSMVYNILNPEDKLKLAGSLEIEHFFNIKFSKALKNMTREEFLRTLVEDLSVKAISVGYNFKFGKAALGNTDWLKSEAAKYGVDVLICDKISYESEPVSSTRIRQALANGDIELANKLLGYEFFVSGVVQHGLKNGRLIGFPTANLFKLSNLEMLKKGVYITEVLIGKTSYRAVSNLGNKPTLGDHELSLETHIFDFEGNLYEREIQVRFLKQIRPEIKFNNFDELTAQIELDSEEARKFCKSI